MSDAAEQMMHAPEVQAAMVALLAAVQSAAKAHAHECRNLTVAWVIAPGTPGPVDARCSSIIWGDDDEEIIDLVLETICDPEGTRPAPEPLNRVVN